MGIDDETRSMVSAIARTLDRASTLVVVTGGPDEPGVQEARIHGGRVVSVDFNAPESLKSLSLWRNLERLYLMSADPATNAFWLDTITRALSAVGHRQRLPLTVRIDDPWQAEAWRAEQLGGSDTRWAADAVGKYEVTARWLLENIIATATIQHVFVCGTSELTLALCADMTRRKLEYDYYSEPAKRRCRHSAWSATTPRSTCRIMNSTAGRSDSCQPGRPSTPRRRRRRCRP